MTTSEVMQSLIKEYDVALANGALEALYSGRSTYAAFTARVSLLAQPIGTH
jgi:hypothetical protein